MTETLRRATVDRATSESTVHIEVDLDGTGRSDVATGVGFYDHMLTSFSRHSLIDLVARTEGDTHAYFVDSVSFGISFVAALLFTL